MTLNNITAKDNLGGSDGVYVDNTYNGNAQAVTLNGLYNLFEGNTHIGLEIYSRGTVTLNNVNANYNTNQGVYVDNTYNSTAQPIYVKGTNVAETNGGNGFEFYSKGIVSMNAVTANNNGGNGVYIDNTYYSGAQAVMITGINQFIDNGAIGLEIYSKGAVTLASITASSNVDQGIYLDNHFNGTPLNVTSTGYVQVRDNGEIGLEIYSRGIVTLANVTAVGNGGTSDNYGVYILNAYSPASQMGVTLSGVNTINNNSYTGLRIGSYGAVTLSNMTVINNGTGVYDGSGYGVHITNTGGTLVKPVTISGTNVFNYNEDAGLRVITDGAITLSKPSAYYNGSTGVYLNNLGTAQSNVTISGYGLFNYNGYYGGVDQDGLQILSHGAITLANITADKNYGTGADLYTIGFNAPHAVTLTGTNTFEYNGTGGSESGLLVNADGNITISNLTAGHNYYRGADLDNNTNWFTNPYRTTVTPLVPFTTFGSIFLNGFGNFVGNTTGDGLFGDTHGSITTTRVYASGNGDGSPDRGINLDADVNITMTCTVAYGNNFRNLDLSAGNKITLAGLLSFGGVGSTTDLFSYTTFVQTLCP